MLGWQAIAHISQVQRGIVDQDVDAAEGLNGLGRHGLYLGFF
jgi:hypothetical protein